MEAIQSVQLNWGQAIFIVLSILVPMMGFFFWVRKDMKNDMLLMKSDMKDFKDEIIEKLNQINSLLLDNRDRVSRVEGQEDFSRSAILELWKRGDKKE